MKKVPIEPTLTAYRRALSATVLAHARYLAVRDDKGATRHLIERRREEWQAVEQRKAILWRQVAAEPARHHVVDPCSASRLT